MLSRRTLLATFTALLATGCATVPEPDIATLTEQVRAAETGFSRAMADRRFDTFASFVADDAVFINGGKPLRGKAAVLAHWQRFFQSPQAPFTWRPEWVEVLPSGRIAYSEGPVAAPDGTVSLRYVSTWRREADGRWLVVLDNGYPVLPAAKP